MRVSSAGPAKQGTVHTDHGTGDENHEITKVDGNGDSRNSIHSSNGRDDMTGSKEESLIRKGSEISSRPSTARDVGGGA